MENIVPRFLFNSVLQERPILNIIELKNECIKNCNENQWDWKKEVYACCEEFQYKKRIKERLIVLKLW